GQRVTWEAGAQIPINLPGLRGMANLSLREGALSVEIPDLGFTIPQLEPLHFADIRIAAGKLAGRLEVGQDMQLPVPGGKVTLRSGSNLAIDGGNFTGAINGSFELGPDGAAVLAGDGQLTYAGGSLDGSVTITRAALPGIEVSGVTVGVTGLFQANQVTV